MLEQLQQRPKSDTPPDPHKKAHHYLLHEVQDHAQKLFHSKAGKAIKEGATNEAKKIVKNETDGGKGGVDLVKTVVQSAKTGHVDKKDVVRAIGDAGKVISATPIGVHKMIITDAAKEAAKHLPESVQPIVHTVEKVIDVKQAVKHGNLNHLLDSSKNIHESVHPATPHSAPPHLKV